MNVPQSRARIFERYVLPLWLALWVLFWIRPFLTGRSELTRYLVLLSSDFESRRQQAFGKDLHEYLGFCKSHLPPGSRFQLVGFEYTSVARARALYDLYPSRLSPSPKYLLVFQSPAFHAEDADLVAFQSPGNFILKLRPKSP
ncbi:MAG: hypothetical protein AB1898_27390 [Acidobacteriota bacterium]